ncbi:MAG: hypothetical protein IK137_03610 [Bacilli bacterium]|nr:hypothetical protein [Bacilli bacterium]
MAIEDNIQAVNTEAQVKVNKERAANSIRYKPASTEITRQNYDKLMGMIAKREETIAKLKEEINQEVEKGVPQADVVENNVINAKAVDIAKLEEQINILGAVYEPMELVDKRAIRLIDKMYKEAKAKSEGIYYSLSSNGITREGEIKQQPMADMFNNMTIVSDLDVQKIADDNQEEVNNNIENAINDEKSLGEGDIKAVIDEALVTPEVPSTEAEEENGLDMAEIDRIVNEKLNNFINKQETPVVEPENSSEVAPVEAVIPAPVEVTPAEPVIPAPVEVAPAEPVISAPVEVAPVEAVIPAPVYEEPQYDDEYIPMTDEEIARVREKIELDKYNKLYAAQAKRSVEISENKEEPIRDEVIVVPPREESGLTISENKGVIIASSDVKERLKNASINELKELLSAKDKVTEELKTLAGNAGANIEEVRRIDETIAGEEADVEMKLAERRKTKARKEQELKDMLIEQIVASDTRNNDLSNVIKSKEEEIDIINKSIGDRRKKISSMANDTDSVDREIAELDNEMQKIFGGERQQEEHVVFKR